MPPPPPPRKQRPSASGLAEASKQYAAVRTLSFATASDPDMAFGADLPNLQSIGEALEESTEHGVNFNTGKMDDRAWGFWEHVCATWIW